MGAPLTDTCIPKHAVLARERECLPREGVVPVCVHHRDARRQALSAGAFFAFQARRRGSPFAFVTWVTSSGSTTTGARMMGLGAGAWAYGAIYRTSAERTKSF